MGLVDSMNAMPVQPAPKPPVDFDKWADEIVRGAKQFIQDHLQTPQSPTQTAQTSQNPDPSRGPAAPQQTTAAAETTQVVGASNAHSTNMLDGVLQSWSRVHGKLDKLVSKDKAYKEVIRLDPEAAKNRPEIRQFYDEYNLNLLALQMEMGEVSFAMEVASKVIEHGTSAAKTAMQTQI